MGTVSNSKCNMLKLQYKQSHQKIRFTADIKQDQGRKQFNFLNDSNEKTMEIF
jgi:hypothetical protein